MPKTRRSIHGEWSSHWAFVLAATGAAVGLGNVWKFPYIAGENGGGAFVLFYLLCVIVIGVPLMMAEIMLGRNGRANPAATMRTLALESGASKHWQIIGIIGVLAGFLILTYYSVIAGWTLDYVFQAVGGDFTGQNAKAIAALFTNLVSSPFKLLFWTTLVMVLTVSVIAKGVEKGIERAVIFMFPTMLFLLLILIGYAMDTGFFETGVTFLFHPDFHKLTGRAALVALGHAFFTLSLATGSIMMYGAYLPRKASVAKASITIAAADTGIALIAGLAIYPIVFANNLAPGAGPGLIFTTLPIAFGQMPYGEILGTIFFIMLFLAAFTSAISLLEPSVAWLIENTGWKRPTAAMVVGSGIWLLSFGTIFSFNLWANYKWFGLNVFELLDYLTANLILPLGGLFIAIFAAWFLKKRIALRELRHNKGKLFLSWRFTLRYIAPIAIVIVFLNFVGII